MRQSFFKHILQIIITSLVFYTCNSKKQELSNFESELLKIEKINSNIFQHTSYLKTKSFGKVPCNGMIYLNGNEAIVFDAPLDDKASSQLINWIGKEKIKAVVVTHFHIDCLAGLNEFHSHGIKSYATNKTIKLAKEDSVVTLPQYSFENQYEFRIGNEVVLAKYFGEGHTKDNIIGYIPSEKTLFGGCLIKALNAPKGNLADANILEWSYTVGRIKKELPSIKTVIPGHGKSGNTELLEYTINLFKKKED